MQMCAGWMLDKAQEVRGPSAGHGQQSMETMRAKRAYRHRGTGHGCGAVRAVRDRGPHKHGAASAGGLRRIPKRNAPRTQARPGSVGKRAGLCLLPQSVAEVQVPCREGFDGGGDARCPCVSVWSRVVPDNATAACVHRQLGANYSRTTCESEACLHWATAGDAVAGSPRGILCRM